MAERGSSGHERHDLLLIAAWVSGDADPRDATAASEVASRCPDCATLAADLSVLRSATQAVPPAMRQRDFRLTPADAERLQASRGLLARLRGARAAGFTRPLAGAMAALGLAGLLLTTVPLGAPSAAPESDRIQAQQAPAGAAGAAGAAAGQSAAAQAAASQELLPVSRGSATDVSPVPGDAAASANVFGAEGERDTQASLEQAPTVAAPAPPDAGDTALQSGATTSSADPVRPAIAVASAALLAGGVLLLLLTARRGRRAG